MDYTSETFTIAIATLLLFLCFNQVEETDKDLKEVCNNIIIRHVHFDHRSHAMAQAVCTYIWMILMKHLQ